MLVNRRCGPSAQRSAWEHIDNGAGRRLWLRPVRARSAPVRSAKTDSSEESCWAGANDPSLTAFIGFERGANVCLARSVGAERRATRALQRAHRMRRDRGRTSDRAADARRGARTRMLTLDYRQPENEASADTRQPGGFAGTHRHFLEQKLAAEFAHSGAGVIMVADRSAADDNGEIVCLRSPRRMALAMSGASSASGPMRVASPPHCSASAAIPTLIEFEDLIMRPALPGRDKFVSAAQNRDPRVFARHSVTPHRQRRQARSRRASRMAPAREQDFAGRKSTPAQRTWRPLRRAARSRFHRRARRPPG